MLCKSSLQLLLGQLCVKYVPKRTFALKPRQHHIKYLRRLSSTVIDGRVLSDQLLAEIRDNVQSWVDAGNRKPRLVAILVGNDVASHTYVRNKMIAAEKTGINSETLNLPDTISELALLSKIYELNSDETVDGILVQLPVPRHINEKLICNAVIPTKDVDGFHLSNLGRLCVNLKCHIPPTSAAVMEVLKSTGVSAHGKHAVVCGRSKNVGLPIAVLLHSSSSGDPDICDATTTICHRHTPPEMLRMLASTADILVTATGIPGLVTGDMVKEGAVVIDVGITRITDERTGRTRLVGDVDFNSARKKASFITPVPGGVGPVTVAMLMRNTLQAARHEVNFNWTS